MDNPKAILSPDGVAVVLDKIVSIDPVLFNYGRGPEYNFYYFEINMLNGKMHRFTYQIRKYADGKDELLTKIENIRMEILKMMNNSIEVRELLGAINLRKDG